VGNHFGIEKDSINEALENYAPGLNRSQFVETEKNKVILDAYNANPDSMDAAINNFRQLNAERKVVILGDMFELGDYSAKAHEDIVKTISESGFYKIYLAGSEFEKAAHNTSMHVFSDLQSLMDSIGESPIEDSLVLLKGSRGMEMERLLKVL
jgi:UDP-N-acetylmuramoyl-tripeptide--D-alanyl-D-alanine ligase